METMTWIDFEVTWAKVKVKLLWILASKLSERVKSLSKEIFASPASDLVPRLALFSINWFWGHKVKSQGALYSWDYLENSMLKKLCEQGSDPLKNIKGS